MGTITRHPFHQDPCEEGTKKWRKTSTMTGSARAFACRPCPGERWPYVTTTPTGVDRLIASCEIGFRAPRAYPPRRRGWVGGSDRWSDTRSPQRGVSAPPRQRGEP